MKTKLKTLIAVIVAVFMIQSCTKEEGVTTGKEITGKVMYTDGVAEGAIIYITYGSTEATEAYDDATLSSADGTFSFAGLNAGDYFIDAVYTDENNVKFNTPGYHVELGSTEYDMGEINLD